MSSSQVLNPEIVIVGGGVIGCSIAYHLARRGLSDIVVVERNTIGSGSTSRAMGGIRQQFSTEPNIKLGMYSVGFFEHFRENMGLAPDDSDLNFHQDGYLFLLTREQDWQVFQENVALQKRLGLGVELLTPHEAAEICPGLYTDDLLGATYCPTDGHGSQHEVTQIFARCAREAGVRFWENCPVTSLQHQNRQILAVETERGTLRPRLVIGCAGAWSGLLGGMAEVDIPVEPLRRTLFYSEPFYEIPAHIPMTVDVGTGFHFRREGPGVLLAEAKQAQLPDFDITTDWPWLDTVVEHAMARMPCFERLQIRTGWSGLYDNSPDHTAIIGAVPEYDNFLVATGFSGHGFMQSPATGLLMAELILDGQAHTIDITQLGLERFRRGEWKKERNVI